MTNGDGNMGEPVEVALDDETMARLEKTARRRGMSVQQLVSRLAEGDAERKASAREWSPPAETIPAKPKTAQEIFDEFAARQTQMTMMKMMANMGMSPDGGESVTEVVRREIREALGKNGGGEDDPETMIERMLARKARLKALKELAGDDQPASKYLDDRLREVTDKLGEMSKENLAMRSENEKLRQERLAEDQRRAQDETKTQIAQVADAVSFLQEQIKNQRSAPSAPKDAFQEAEEMMDKLERIKKKLGAGGKEPDLVDRLDRIGDVATKHFATAADSAAKIIAATHGTPPADYASEPSAPAYTEPAESATADLSAAEVAKLQSSVAEMRKSGYACDPTDYTTWPDVSYSVQKGDRLIATSRQDWVRTYGHMAAPSLPGIPKREATPSPPAPASAPAPEPPKTASAPLDLSRLLSSGTEAKAPPPSPAETPAEGDVGLLEPEPDSHPASSEPTPVATPEAPVTVDAEGKIVQGAAVADEGTTANTN